MPDNPKAKKPVVGSTGDAEEHEPLRSNSGNPINPPFSPPSRAKSSLKLRKKSKPHLKRLSSGHNKLVFSVDDDVKDVNEEDLNDEQLNELYRPKNKAEREYLEGYNAALKALYLKKSKKELPSDGSYFPDISKIDEAIRSGSTGGNMDPAIESNIKKHLLSAEENLKALENLDGENTPANIVNTPLIDDDSETQSNMVVEENEDDVDDNGSVKSSSSSETIESLNLRERQDAINSTHPFGIKIWKPSLYKKKRSVATRAEEDIHDYQANRLRGIFWGVYLTNFLWTVTFGLLLWAVCMLCAMLLLVATGFGIKKTLRPYFKLIFNLSRYWLYPFGKFVILNKDENYLDEDDIYGSSINEFQRWRNEEEGRLFFAPPRRYTNANNESRPLIKDHRGRPLRDSYTFLNDENSEENTTHSNNDSNNNNISSVEEEDEFLNEDEDISGNDIKVRFFGRGRWTWSRIVFYLLFYGILQPICYAVGAVCWLIVFTIPMTNVTAILCAHLRHHPLALHFEDEKSYYTAKRTEADQRKRKNQLILLCTYRCSGWHYYKYTLDGTNVFFINLLFAVIFVIFDFYILKSKLNIEAAITEPVFLFCACLFSTIPLAFFIGQAVASISAQSSMGVGAVINAFFSTVVEIFLYCVALSQAKGKIVEGGMIGSVLAGVLLLPGLSMCAGALKRKTQRYNPRSAGVSSTMLLFGMVTMFAPSLFYQIYGSYEIKCTKCEVTATTKEFADDCAKCRFIQPSFTLDKLYHSVIKPFSLTVAVALLLAYVCGLFFTLRTHASLIWATTSSEHHTHKKDDAMSLRSPSIVSLDHTQPVKNSSSGAVAPAASNKSAAHNTYASGIDPSKRGTSSLVSSALPSPSIEVSKQRNPKLSLQTKRPASEATTPNRRASVKNLKVEEEEEGEGSGHDAPNWSRSKSTIILLSATLLYAVIAEILVDVVDDVLKDYPLNPKFLGLTVFALVPNTTEFINAISFASGGNVALSMEIGSAYALQVVLIQIPVLAIYSIVQGFQDPSQIFSLVFPRWDIIATLISIYLFTYIYAEGKSNYFKGVILMLIYIVVLVGFWLNDKIEGIDDEYSGPPSIKPYF